MKSLKGMVKVNLDAMEAYNTAVVELHNLEVKLEKARKVYEKWLDVVLTCELEKMNDLADEKLCPAWRKVAKLQEKVNAAKVKLDKIKCRMAWSGMLSSYVSKSKIVENVENI